MALFLYSILSAPLLSPFLPSRISILLFLLYSHPRSLLRRALFSLLSPSIAIASPLPLTRLVGPEFIYQIPPHSHRVFVAFLTLFAAVAARLKIILDFSKKADPREERRWKERIYI